VSTNERRIVISVPFASPLIGSLKAAARCMEFLSLDYGVVIWSMRLGCATAPSGQRDSPLPAFEVRRVVHSLRTSSSQKTLPPHWPDCER
jgi:hypothetical protein